MAQLSTPAPLLERLLSPHHAPLEGAAGTLDSYSVFPVPDMPRIGRHTEPRPFHKSAPGYDMKTLRRQLDAMAGELEERFALQAALYRQNESLWAFAESLLRLNQQYGEQTGRQLTVLQTRFRLLQGERVGVCVQMVEAQVSLSPMPLAAAPV